MLSCNIYSETLERLNEANETEKCCIVSINDQVKQLRTLLAEEKLQHDQYRGITMLQRKQINGLEQKLNDKKSSVKRVHVGMKERIEDSLKKGAEDIQNLENTTNNLAARQSS